ncbi:MAG: FecR domain-containing protein, partial [Verrucomicrobia bacterium]|nr:FecR domain-containing protein [Verrucomicrobiota bacterium]
MNSNSNLNDRRFTVTGFCLLFCLGLPGGTTAGAAESLKSAIVTDANNEVVVFKKGGAQQPIKIGDKIADQDIVSTGDKSRVELEFPDGSLVRLGSNAVFSFDGASRDMRVERGAVLVHVPPNSGGAQINTPEATTAIHGDVVALRVLPSGATAIVALSRDLLGPVTVKHKRSGEKKSLRPGQMLNLLAGALSMAQPSFVNAGVFIQSSILFSSGGKKREREFEMKKDLGIDTKERRDEVKEKQKEVEAKKERGGGDGTGGTGTGGKPVVKRVGEQGDTGSGPGKGGGAGQTGDRTAGTGGGKKGGSQQAGPVSGGKGKEGTGRTGDGNKTSAGPGKSTGEAGKEQAAGKKGGAEEGGQQAEPVGGGKGEKGTGETGGGKKTEMTKAEGGQGETGAGTGKGAGEGDTGKEQAAGKKGGAEEGGQQAEPAGGG